MERRATRRELVVGATAATVGAALGAVPAAGADAAPPSDRDLLSDALDVERLMVLAYRRVLASGTLTPGIERAVKPHLQHERAHVATVAAKLEGLGAPAPTGPLSLTAASDAL